MTRASAGRRAAREQVMHCHVQVKKVAIGLAQISYENLMSSSNGVWAEWKRRYPGLGAKALEDRFVKKYWGAHIGAARTTMARLLTEPIDEALKTQIEEALILDASLMRGRRNPAVLLGSKAGSQAQ